MANTKKETTTEEIEKFRSRVFMLMLYPDNEQHATAIEKIPNLYDYAMITHDRDKWTAEDEKKDPKHKEGENKKTHVHIVIRTTNGIWNTALAKKLGIDVKWIQDCKKEEGALKYLIHKDNPEKAQYEVEEVKGTLKARMIEALNKGDKSEGEKVVDLILYIKSYEGKLTVTDFAFYCATNGYWAEFRRSGAIFCKMIEERNNRESVR